MAVLHWEGCIYKGLGQRNEDNKMRHFPFWKGGAASEIFLVLSYKPIHL